jgi:hypothetical protein
MKKISTAAVLLSVISSAAPSQVTQTPEQHQTTGQPTAKPGGERCEQMMHEMHEMHTMMTEMMRMHQGMVEHSSHDADKDKPQDKPKP